MSKYDDDTKDDLVERAYYHDANKNNEYTRDQLEEMSFEELDDLIYEMDKQIDEQDED